MATESSVQQHPPSVVWGPSPRRLKVKSGLDSAIMLDVGGKKFKTTVDTLKKLPNTKLGRLALADKTTSESGTFHQLHLQPNGEYFFDRNPKIMTSILDLYRTGELHLPTNVCYSVVEEELKYWGIPIELISACCWKHFENHRSERNVVTEMQNFLQGPYADVVIKKTQSLRMKLWCLLERPRHSLTSRIWSFLFFIFVFLAVFSFVFESDRNSRVATDTFAKSYLQAHNKTLEDAYKNLTPVHFMAVTVPKPWLHWLRYITFAFFLSDFLMRLITCPDRRQFFKQSRNWLEIAVALKSSLHFVMETLVFARETDHISEGEKALSLIMYALSGVRVLRVLYLANMFPGLKIYIMCVKHSFRDLLMICITVACLVGILGSLVYMSEAVSGSKVFHDLGHAMWWAIFTMTTVGYGEVFPQHTGGKLVAVMCAMSGFTCVALPISIIGSYISTIERNIKSCKHVTTRKVFLGRNTGLWMHLLQSCPRQTRIASPNDFSSSGFSGEDFKSSWAFGSHCRRYPIIKVHPLSLMSDVEIKSITDEEAMSVRDGDDRSVRDGENRSVRDGEDRSIRSGGNRGPREGDDRSIREEENIR